MTLLIKQIFSLLYFLVLTPKSDGALKSSFGESCSKDHRCDSRAMLTCSNKGFCECLMTSSMIFDSTSKKCVTLAGEKCSYTVTESERSLSELLPCISNSECVDGICSCESGFFEHSNGTCEAKRSQGQGCSTDNMCTNNLICDKLTLTCGCDNDTNIDKAEGACLNKAGHECSLVSSPWCVENSRCRSDRYGEEKCLCNDDTFEMEGSCETKRDFGESCKSGSDTMCETKKGLRCGETGLCICDRGLGYDTQTKKCAIAPDQLCDDYGPYRTPRFAEFPDCVENSICTDVCDEDYKDECYKRCQCDIKFVPSASTGSCVYKPGFGEECLIENDCNPNLKLVCGKNKTCECEDGRSFDLSSERCLLGPGRKCDMNGDIDCVSNAYCHRLSYGNYECRCYSKYFSTSNYTCEKKRGHGEDCFNDSHCAETTESGDFSFLRCLQGKCVCDPDSTVTETSSFSNNSFPCARKVGRSCSSKEKCMIGAKCNTGNICECIKNDYWQTSEDICSPKKGLGEVCEMEEECQQNLRLSCSKENGKCLCNEKSALHPVFNVCVAKVGEKCKEEVTGPKCAPNAVCLEGKCVCNQSTSLTNPTLGDGLCYSDEGQICDSDEFRRDLAGGSPVWRTCLSGLRCQNSTCSCLFKDHQIYDKKSMTCLSLVRGPCENSECVDDAECFENHSRKRCRCKEGFTPRDRVCDMAYGSNCTQGLHPTSRCDRLAPLGCSVRGICECSDFQVYDKETKKCRGLVGAKCVMEERDFCVSGGHCLKFRSGKGDTGSCECQSENGYVERNGDGLCILMESKVEAQETQTEGRFFLPYVSDSDGNPVRRGSLLGFV